jgi:hypothetical protein
MKKTKKKIWFYLSTFTLVLIFLLLIIFASFFNSNDQRVENDNNHSSLFNLFISGEQTTLDFLNKFSFDWPISTKKLKNF